ncbi:hypothetical protein HIM_08102 [Hirsutella minnesotensis 3608]|uniref:chitinase n=1 Tax=Hirsutella minnesotensis 3608 TaxID=1043627 RepID=A0A0F7ZT66_9HYPO|nr:hypothetical protein HIM_08102 [Hirsutella minnesotensis 3608]
MALSLSSAATYGAFNGYWGQGGGARLSTFCDSGIQYATIGFVNRSPENDDSGAEYPGINFSSHCWAESFSSPSGRPTQLLSHCQELKDDIPYCQSKGVKVILSIGGVWNKKRNNYEVTTDENGEYFADFLYNAFGPYRKEWTGPRPFDSDNQQVAVDGFDFDIEASFENGNGPYIAMVDKLRALDNDLIITAAPQCPFNPTNALSDLIQKAAFDALFIQFYNNPVCDAIPNNTPGDKFNLDAWVKVLAKSDKSKNAKLFVGLLSSPSASPSGSGYIAPDEVKDLICNYKDTQNWGGISLWDMEHGHTNIVDGKSFNEHVLDALANGCTPPPSSTVTSKPVPTSITSKPVSTSVTSKPVPTSITSKPVPTSVTSKPVPTSVTSEPIPTSAVTTSKWSNSTTPVIPSTAYTTVIRTITSCPPEVTNCPNTSHVVTETLPVFTPVRPVTPEVPSKAPVTTSTVYTTKVRTITSCPPQVTDCPNKSHVITETLPLYTTVRPVTAEPEPTAQLTTSTVYTTRVHTVTACPPEVVDCPKGKVVTETIPLYTTVCPVTSTAQPTVPNYAQSGVPAVVTRTAYATRTRTVTCAAGATDCRNGQVITEVVSWQTTATGVEATPSTLAKTPKPSSVGDRIGRVGSECDGARCPSVSSVPSIPQTGCSGQNCTTGNNDFTQGRIPTPFKPAAPSAVPVAAGSSSLVVSMTGLLAVVAASMFAL